MSDEIFDFLVASADKYGETAVRLAIRKYTSRRQRAIASGAAQAKRKSIPKKWIERALERQQGVCVRCGDAIDPTAKDSRMRVSGDHRTPISTGGEHASHNIDAMHSHCNSAKGNRSEYEDMKRTKRSLLDRIRTRGE